MLGNLIRDRHHAAIDKAADVPQSPISDTPASAIFSIAMGF
jgi:hypothetical protein